MQLSHSQRYIIQILTIATNVFFFNLPLIIIIILSILPNGKMDSYAIVAFYCSLISLLIGSLTLISRCLSTKCKFNYHFNETKILYCFSIKSNELKTNHKYCHSLFAECLSHSLE